jgi:hypothetical protein
LFKLTTTISHDTARKMREIAQMLGLSDKRYFGTVIEKAVDLLYQTLKTTNDLEFKKEGKE